MSAMASYSTRNKENLLKDRLRSKKLIIPVFVPHMGCPHDCCFCNQRTISGQITQPTEEDILEIIGSYSNILQNYGSIEVAFYGGSFTAIPMEQQALYLNTARSICDFYGDRAGKMIDFRISTRPDCIDEDVLSLLKKYGVKTIELGAQSMCNEVLIKSGRGHLAEDTVNASELIKKEGFILGLQTMLGLPGSDKDKELYTAGKVIDLHPELVRIYPTIVIEGTALAKSYYKEEYKPLELNEAVELCAEIIPKYEKNEITVIRTGLQSSDNISENGRIAAGPYHSAFGELVRSRIILNWICDELEKVKTYKNFNLCLYFKNNNVKIFFDGDKLVIKLPKKLVSQFVGQHRCNIIYIGKRYSYYDIEITAVD